MSLLLKNWFHELKTELKDYNELRIISPFISNYFFHKIKNKFDLSKIKLVTRFDLKDFSSGVSDIEALRLLHENKGQIFGIKKLHSKVYIIDARIAIVSSSNLTRNGLHTNFECGFKIESEEHIQQLLDYFKSLTEIAKDNRFNIAKYDDWCEQLKSIETLNSPRNQLPDLGSDELPIKIDSNRTYYVKFFGTANAREGLDFPIEEEIRRGLCHYACGFSEKKKPRQINDNDIIYFARLTKEPNDYSIFGKATAIKYNEERDRATEQEIIERPWKKDWPIYLRVKNAKFINGNLEDCTLMSKLIDEMDCMAFQSTKDRYEKGERNINPKRSLSQQPYIKLSLEGASWVEQHFKNDISNNGEVGSKFIRSLPNHKKE